MKRAFYVTVTLLCLAVLNATANAQDTQEPPPDPCEKKAGCVKTDYDRFKDRTTVAMTPVLLVPKYGYGSPLEGIHLAIIFSSPGKIIQRPDKAILYFMAMDAFRSGQEPLAFSKSQDIDLLIDGVPHPLGAVSSLSGKKTDLEYMVSPTWTYFLEVQFDTIEKIGAAKRVEIRAGSVETFLDADARAAFRRLAELAPKKESTPAGDAISPREVKRPKSKRSQRRLKP